MSEHELWNELGNLYFLSGAYPQAVHAYHRAIKLDEGSGRPYSNLALTYVQQGKFDQAVDLYRRSIELLAENKEKAISWSRLGNVYRTLRNYQEALRAYQRADELDPENGTSDDRPGWLSEPAGGNPPADLVSTRYLDTVLPVHPGPESDTTPPDPGIPSDQPTERATSTWAVAEASPYQEDVSPTPESLSLTTWGDSPPGDMEAEWPPETETEIILPDADGDPARWIPVPDEAPMELLEPAVEDLESAAEVEIPEDSATILAVPGMATPEAPPTYATSSVSPGAAVQQESSTTVDLAVEERPNPVWDDAAQQPEPGTVEEPAELAAPPRDEHELQEIELGLERYRLVVEINPQNAHAWDTLGNLYKSAGRYEEAIDAYRQAIENDASKALYHHHLALVYASEGRMEDAIDSLQQVIAIEPDHSLAHAALGGYYRKMGLEELAQKHVGKAMKSIFDSENEYNRACLAAICGDTDQALRLLRVALQNKQTYVDWILRDPDLDFIRQDPRFKQLISDYAR
jgi:tetratricopeptide (TPR) repeat protein